MPVDLTPTYSIKELRSSKKWSATARFVQEQDYLRVVKALKECLPICESAYHDDVDRKRELCAQVCWHAVETARAALDDSDPAMPIDQPTKSDIVRQRPVRDVCLAGAPALNGVCGDRDCVCAKEDS